MPRWPSRLNQRDAPAPAPVDGKGPRFAAMAIRHYIAVLEAGMGHCYEDQSFFENDIAMYHSILKVLDEGRWP